MTTLADIAGLTDTRHRHEVARRLDPLLPGPPLAGLGRQAIAAKAAMALATQLDDPLDQLVTDACEQDAAFQEQADAATLDKRQPTTITLGRQTISRVEHPRLELEAANIQKPLLELTLAVEVTFTALVLDVLDGQITRIYPTDAEVSVTLTAAGVEVAHREKVPLTFPDASAENTHADRRDRHDGATKRRKVSP